MPVADYLRAVPKVELHVHLEGAIQPATLLTLAERNGITLPATTEPELRDWFRFRDFPHFAETYITITRCLRTVDDYDLIAYEFGAEMARQHVRYAEVTFSPSTHRALGVSDETMIDGLTNGRLRAREEFGVEMAWVFDIVRWITTMRPSGRQTTRPSSRLPAGTRAWSRLASVASSKDTRRSRSSRTSTVRA